MLRNFAVGNWKSIYDEVDFSMVATAERKHGERLKKVGRSRLLPVAAIYGPNAAGKSSLIEALKVLQQLVIEQNNDLQESIKPNLSYGTHAPTRFIIEFTVFDKKTQKNHSFIYELTVNQAEIRHEVLATIDARKQEKILFERYVEDFFLNEEIVGYDKALALTKVISREQTFLGALGRLARDYPQAIPPLAFMAYQWFLKTLVVIPRNAHYMHLPARIAHDKVFKEAMNQGLSVADTGITGLALVETNRARIPLCEKDYEDALVKLRRTGGFINVGTPDEGYFLIYLDKDNQPVFKEVVARHEKPYAHTGKPLKFELSLREESDGTKRYMDLLPILIDLTVSNEHAVYVIDELEHSMHPELTRDFIERFLEGQEGTTFKQLIFTTHELLLMRGDMLRRDEIWLTETIQGITEMSRISDYAQEGCRDGNDLLRWYLSGRLGALPRT